MPAQTEEGQIPVPVFRMLGSDPIYQYDDGLGKERQGVISLEPVYSHAGMSRSWVDYFFESLVNEPCLAFNYAQVGQENSFIWANMQKGLEMQIPLIDSLFRCHKIRVETLCESGRWFKSQYNVTPATAVTVWKDIRGEGNKTVWYNSRFYRANLLWERGTFRFRDIHLFDEDFKSAYLETPGTGNQFLFYTLPVVDGFMWSEADDRAGLRIVRLGTDGKVSEEVAFLDPQVSEEDASSLSVTGKDQSGNLYRIVLSEDNIKVCSSCISKDVEWCMELHTAKGKELPFTSIEDKTVQAEFDGFLYAVNCMDGRFVGSKSEDSYVFRIFPADNCISLDCRLE